MNERRLPAPDECAACGAAIPKGVLACPECGADERTGWREQSIYDGLDLPDAETTEKRTSTKIGAVWKATGILLLIIVVLLVFRGGW